jgi:hypothetical protein
MKVELMEKFQEGEVSLCLSSSYVVRSRVANRRLILLSISSSREQNSDFSKYFMNTNQSVQLMEIYFLPLRSYYF